MLPMGRLCVDEQTECVVVDGGMRTGVVTRSLICTGLHASRRCVRESPGFTR